MDIKSIRYIIIVAIIVVLLGSLLVFTNVVGSYEKMNRVNESRVTTTTKKVNQDTPEVVGDKIEEAEDGVIIVNGEVVNIALKEYNAIVGYKVNYVYEYFNPVKINTATLALINNSDNNIFVKIELMSETNYYREYNDSLNGVYNNSAEVDGYGYEYKFYRGNGLYLKVTRCTHQEEIDYNLIPMMNYMINSLEIN